MGLSAEEKKTLEALQRKAEEPDEPDHDEGILVLRGSRADAFLASIGLGPKKATEPKATKPPAKPKQEPVDDPEDADQDDEGEESEEPEEEPEPVAPKKDPKPERSGHRYFGG